VGVSVADDHEILKGGTLLRAESQDAAEALGRLEAAYTFALVDDAASEARSYAWQPRDLLDGGAVDVERPRIRRGR